MRVRHGANHEALVARAPNRLAVLRASGGDARIFLPGHGVLREVAPCFPDLFVGSCPSKLELQLESHARLLCWSLHRYLYG